MDSSPAEHSALQDIRSGLAEVGLSQGRAARLIRKSPAMVSMVLNEKAKSEIVLTRLCKLIKRRQAKCREQSASINPHPENDGGAP